MPKKLSKKINIGLIIIFFASVIGLLIWQQHWPKWVVELDEEPLHVLVAKTPKHQYKGLGGRTSLEPYDGMLFIFTIKKRHGFVMRDTLFPIDIIWFDGGEVVDIASNIEPEPGVREADLNAYYPRVAANVVLEVPAGWVAEHGIEIGDRLQVIQD